MFACEKNITQGSISVETHNMLEARQAGIERGLGEAATEFCAKFGLPIEARDHIFAQILKIENSDMPLMADLLSRASELFEEGATGDDCLLWAGAQKEPKPVKVKLEAEDIADESVESLVAAVENKSLGDENLEGSEGQERKINTRFVKKYLGRDYEIGHSSAEEMAKLIYSRAGSPVIRTRKGEKIDSFRRILDRVSGLSIESIAEKEGFSANAVNLWFSRALGGLSYRVREPKEYERKKTAEPTKQQAADVTKNVDNRTLSKKANLKLSGLADMFGGNESMDWREYAVCAQTDPEAFFPEKGESTKEAKKICGNCEVRPSCLEYAVRNEERYGVWGGLSERERRAIRPEAS